MTIRKVLRLRWEIVETGETFTTEAEAAHAERIDWIVDQLHNANNQVGLGDLHNIAEWILKNFVPKVAPVSWPGHPVAPTGQVDNDSVKPAPQAPKYKPFNPDDDDVRV